MHFAQKLAILVIKSICFIIMIHHVKCEAVVLVISSIIGSDSF